MRGPSRTSSISQDPLMCIPLHKLVPCILILPGGIGGGKCYLRKANPDLKGGIEEIPLAINITAELACQLMPTMSISHLSPHIILGIFVSVLV